MLQPRASPASVYPSPPRSFDLRTLPVDFVECLMRFQPTENEVKTLRQFEKERKPLESLTDEDRFMMQFSKIERLMQKMTIMAFIGNFCESVQMLTPVRSTTLWEMTECVSQTGVNCRPLCLPAATARCHCSFGVHQVVSEAKENPGGNSNPSLNHEANVRKKKNPPFFSYFPFRSSWPSVTT